MLVTEVGREGKLKCRKQKKKSTNWAGKASWNPQNHQNSQPKQGKDKLKCRKQRKQLTKQQERQAGIIKIIKSVNQSKKKTSWNDENGESSHRSRRERQKYKKSVSTQIALQYNEGSIQGRDVHEQFIVFVVRRKVYVRGKKNLTNNRKVW